MDIETPTSQQLWRTAFDRQYTKEMLADLVKRSTALIKRFERFTPRKSTDTAEDRIHTAVMKLLDGARTWDPSRVDLCGFLLGIVCSDLSSEMRRSKLVPHVSLDERKPKREDDYTGEECEDTAAEPHSALEDRWCASFASEARDAAWSLAMTHLRELAGDDKRVITLLDCWEDGATQKREVIARTKWTSRVYKDAYERLMRLADAADQSIREAIAYALSN